MSTFATKYHNFARIYFLSIVAFAVTLELTYPYTNFPVSDAVKEFLPELTSSLIRWAGITSIAYIMAFMFIIALLIFIRTIFRVMMHYRPAFKAKVEERRAALLAKRQAAEAANPNSTPKRSACSIWTEVIANLVVCGACVVNDSIYNRAEGTAIVEGAWARFSYNAAYCAALVAIELLAFSLFFLIAVLIKVRCARRGQIRLDGDEEIRIGSPGETTEVVKGPVTLSAGFDEKLIDISDDMEKFSEKMQQTEVGNTPSAPQH